jgi:hypothetical protein
LLQHAESHGFEILVTTDQNLKYQQNLANRKIAVVVLSSTSWPRIQKSLPAIVDAIGTIQENGYVEITISQDS